MPHWILEGTEPVEASLYDWATWFEDGNNRAVARTEGEGYIVSTVFLGIDHRYGQPGPPLLFESMVFLEATDGDEGDMRRYATWDEAEAGHYELVEAWREKMARRRGEVTDEGV